MAGTEGYRVIGLKRIYRFLAALCVVLFVSSVSCYSFRALADTPSYTTDTNFWHWLSGGAGEEKTFWRRLLDNNVIPNILGYIPASGVCPVSSDNKHHASTVTGVSDSGYCVCVCEECGDEFTSSTLAGDAYGSYTDTLPASVVDSDGGLVWYPTIDDLYDGSFVVDVAYNSGSSTGVFSFTLSDTNDYYASGRGPNQANFECSRVDNRTFLLIREYYESYAGVSRDGVRGGFRSLKFRAPVTGVYTRFGVQLFSDQGNRDFTSVNITCAEGNSLDSSFSPTEYNCTSFVGYMYFPCFRIAPLVPYNVTSSDKTQVYNIGTRSASISGDYGMVTQSGDIQKIDSATIVNEANNTYYSPVSGEPVEFKDWTYDYSDRSYTLTTTEGDTTTVTYGDEYCTIREGDTVTNIYYITENHSGSTAGDDGGSHSSGGSGTSNILHFHNYHVSVSSSPDCTLPGIKTYTCDCGDSYTEAIPATGHTWEVIKRVTTSYDEATSELLEQGYVIYQCTVCGEQYKSDDGALPPNSYSGGFSDAESSGGTIWGKLGTLLGTIALAPLKVIESLLGVILDGLISLAQLITDSLATLLELVAGWFDVIPGLFGGFVAFLSAVFVFLPEDMVVLLTFGLAAVVFIGIIRAIRGR